MGGKRPDQYAIDAGEAKPTDERNRGGPDLRERDKQEVAESRVEATRESFIPHTGRNPALADLQARREQRRQAVEAEREEARLAAAAEPEAKASGTKRSRATKRGRSTPDAERAE